MVDALPTEVVDLRVAGIGQAAAVGGQGGASSMPPPPSREPALAPAGQTQAPAAQQQRPAADVDAAGLLRAAKRRQKQRESGQTVEGSPLLAALDKSLCARQKPAFSDNYARAIARLTACTCLSATAALAHGANTNDATVRNNIALFERIVCPVIAHQHSIRHNQPPFRLAMQQRLAPCLFARQHTNYAKGLVDDFKNFAQMHPEARALRHSVECVSFSAHAGQNQGVDAVCEERIGKAKRESLGDSDKRWEAALHTIDTSGSVHDTVNSAFALVERARRPRSTEDIDPTLIALCLALREGGAFESKQRSREVDLEGQLLAMSIPRLDEHGSTRYGKFVRERYIDKRVAVGAPCQAGDTAKLALSISANVPPAAKAASRSRGRSRERKGTHRSPSRSSSRSASEAEQDEGDGEDDDEEMDPGYRSSRSDSAARSPSRSPSPRKRSVQSFQGFLAALRADREEKKSL